MHFYIVSPVQVGVEAPGFKKVQRDLVSNDFSGGERQARHDQRHGVQRGHRGREALLRDLETCRQLKDCRTPLLSDTGYGRKCIAIYIFLSLVIPLLSQ